MYKNKNCNPGTFDAPLEQLKSEMILSTAQQTLVDHLETLTKPRSMTVESFVNQLKVVARYVNDIPFPGQDPPTVNQTKLENIIFRAMPVPWHINFLRVNDFSTASVLQIQRSMSQEREFAEQTQNRNNDAHNYQAKGHHTIFLDDLVAEIMEETIMRILLGHIVSGTQITIIMRTSMCTGPRDTPCCIHNGTHLWSQCRDNVNSQNYCGSYQGGGQKDNNQGHGNYNNYPPSYSGPRNQNQNYFQSQQQQQNTQQNPNNQIITYIPSIAGRMQGEH
jgi:hypothetical protein